MKTLNILLLLSLLSISLLLLSSVALADKDDIWDDEDEDVSEIKKKKVKYTYEVIEQGTGKIPKPGQTVNVNFVGRLEDGTVFDSTEGKVPYEFMVGRRKVIDCWEDAIQRSRIGSKLKLVCPPESAFGNNKVGKLIPPNATLTYEIEILGFKKFYKF